jgi:hypothetical protein
VHALGYGFRPFDVYDFNPDDILHAPTAPEAEAEVAPDPAPASPAASAPAEAAAQTAAAETAAAAAAGKSSPEAADGSGSVPVVCMLSNILCYCSDDATADFLAG